MKYNNDTTPKKEKRNNKIQTMLNDKEFERFENFRKSKEENSSECSRVMILSFLDEIGY